MKKNVKNVALPGKPLEEIINRDRQLDFLPRLIELASKQIAPRRVILFGSRARGDHHSRSDVDLAFDISQVDERTWAAFQADAQETMPTLLSLDLVRLDDVQTELINAIQREGIAIYVYGA